MSRIQMPESFAVTLDQTGRQLVADRIMAEAQELPPTNLVDILSMHATLGQQLIMFVERSRQQGLVVPDDEIDDE